MLSKMSQQNEDVPFGGIKEDAVDQEFDFRPHYGPRTTHNDNVWTNLNLVSSSSEEDAPQLVHFPPVNQLLTQENEISFNPSDISQPITIKLGLDLDFEVHEEVPTTIDWSDHLQGHIETEALAEEMYDMYGQVDTDQLNAMFESVSEGDGENAESGEDDDIYGIGDLFDRTPNVWESGDELYERLEYKPNVNFKK